MAQDLELEDSPELEGEVLPGIDFEKLDSFGQVLAKSRSEAIAAREQSGIEQIWFEDEEFYEGIDDMNRGQEKSTMHQKPMFQAPAKTSDGPPTRSTVFPNITGPFVETASARISDMLLPTDDRSWAIKHTPVPDMAKIAKGEVPREIQAQIDQQHPDPAEADGVEKQLVVQAKQQIEAAAEAAEAAQTRIDDWHVESEWHAENRRVIEDAARIGTGVLKGPFPLQKKTVLYRDGDLTESIKIIPGTKRVDPWNFYPTADCGEDIHNGSGCWERDWLSRRQVRELVGQEGYIDEQLQKVMEEGPITINGTYKETPEPVSDPSMKDRFQIWYGYGTAEKLDIEAMGCSCEDMKDPHVPYMVTMINNRVVRLSLNPLDTGDYPYDVYVWRPRSGHWTGIGVARQIRTPQKIVVAGTRNLMDNAGLGAGPMLVMLKGVKPADGLAMGLAPRRVYVVDEDGEAITDARNAIGTIKVDMCVDELMTIIKFGMQLAEMVTSMPMILQGQMGPSVPDTLGGQELFQMNAGTVLRRLAKLYDDRITEPRIRRDYQWLLVYGPDDKEKGDFQIDARGSSALVERQLQNQELIGLLKAFLDPRFGKDPAKGMDEYLKSRHFDPKRFEYDDEQWQKLMENWEKMMEAGQGQDTQVQVAQIRAEAEKYRTDKTDELERLRTAGELQLQEREQEIELILADAKKAINDAEIEADSRKAADALKAKLAETILKIRSTERLVDKKASADQLPKPPTEPPGKAPAGRSYTQ